MAAIWAAVLAPSEDGLAASNIIGLSLLSIRETCGALHPWGSEETRGQSFQKEIHQSIHRHMSSAVRLGSLAMLSIQMDLMVVMAPPCWLP